MKGFTFCQPSLPKLNQLLISRHELIFPTIGRLPAWLLNVARNTPPSKTVQTELVDNEL